MANKRMTELGKTRSVIREIFEYANEKRRNGEKVWDFSIGNPTTPPPEKVNRVLTELASTGGVSLHGYTSAPGSLECRGAISENIRKRHGVNVGADGIYITCGAAASLTITLNAIIKDETDEIIVIAPYFPEYAVFIEKAGGKMKTVPARDSDLMIDIDALSKAINENTAGVIVNSPNNPSGVVYSEENIKALCALLEKKSKELGREIFIISDEPYRELVYGDVFVPYIMNYYPSTVVCYSYSKSLSLPGERIGYIALCPEIKDVDLYPAICGAGRALGYVCAPSMMQAMITRCVDEMPDLSSYKENRDILYNSLKEYGYEPVRPDGAFYLFVKTPGKDPSLFFEKAKKMGILAVPSDSFGMKGYMRIAYCTEKETINEALPIFKKLIE